MDDEPKPETVMQSDGGVTNGSKNRCDSAGPRDSQSLANETSKLNCPSENGAREILPVRQSGGPRTLEGKQKSKLNALKYGIFASCALIKGESPAAYEALLDGLTEALGPAGKLEEILVEKLATTVWRHRRLIQAEGAEIRKGIDLMESERQIRERERARSDDHTPVDPFSLSSEPDHGIVSEINNLFVVQRCLDILAKLHAEITENGFSESDLTLLKHLYGDASASKVGGNLYTEYLEWSDTARASQSERLKEGYSSPEECKDIVLVAINSEIRRLEEHQKLEAARRVVPESQALDRLLRYEASLERIFDRTLNQLERLQRMRLGHPVSPSINLNVSSS
jgi:hypothetical protein